MRKKIILISLVVLILINLTACNSRKKLEEDANKFVQEELSTIDVEDRNKEDDETVEDVADTNVDDTEETPSTVSEPLSDLDIFMQDTNYSEIAKRVAHLVVIDIEDGFDIFKSRYESYFTTDCLKEVETIYNKYYIGGYKYIVTGDDGEAMNDEGKFPIFDDDYNVTHYGDVEEYIKRMTVLSGRTEQKVSEPVVKDNSVNYIVTWAGTVDIEVTLNFNENYLITSFSEEILQ